MPTKSIRAGVYAFLKFKNDIVVIKKWRWPFKWLYDLPWWKIEHWENNIDSLKREVMEEVWLNESDFKINKILSVEEDFVKHVWGWEFYDEHIIAIIYLAEIVRGDFNLNYIENWWDANWLKLIKVDDIEVWKTNILKKILEKI